MQKVLVVALYGLSALAVTGCTDTINGQQEPTVVVTDCADGETENPVTGACEASTPDKSDDPADDENPGLVDPNAKKEEFASDDPWAETDDDGVLDRSDNCPFDANPDQSDSDQDGIGDTCDNCVATANPAQTDSSGQGIGDSCSPEPVGETCGELTSGFEQIAPNIYLVLDKSGSMDGDPLRQAKEGLDQIADELNDEVRFGFGAFPIQLACGVSMTEFLEMGQHDAPTIKSSYSNINADGGTSTPDALEIILNNDLVSEPGDAEDDLRSKVVVLITDGEPNSCGELPGTINAAEALRDAGIPVHVVGFNFGSNPANLNLIAEAGGTDASGGAGGDRYYTADDAGSLVTALRDISQDVIACSYKLETAPEDPDKIWVSVNGSYLGDDAYTFDGGTNTLTLGEETCNELRESDPDATTLEITLGCKTACVPGEFWGCCLDDGDACRTDADCCFGNCKDGVCQDPCRPSGVSCTEDSQCCSNVCGADADGNSICIEP